MRMTSKSLHWIKGIAALFMVMVLGSAGSAGVLDGHASALVSGNTPFTDGADLTGSVDWAVFEPGDFPFTGGYTPTPGEAVYAYEVFITGADFMTTFSLPLSNPANNIGSFTDISGDAPTSASISGIPGSGIWSFSGVTASTRGLAISSPQAPEDSFAVVVNGGSFALPTPVPVPGASLIPEPGTVALMSIGGLFLLLRRRR